MGRGIIKKEIIKFENIEKPQKKEMSASSDAVKNLLKEGGTKGNVIIFDNSDDVYKKDAQKILQQLQAQEQKDEAETKARQLRFAKGVGKQF